MELKFTPWVALVLGILIGWLLQWFLELWFFRKRRLECQRRLSELEADLRTREAELLLEREHAASLEADLTALRARAAAAEVAPLSAEVAAPQLEAEPSEAAVAAPHVAAELPETEAARAGAEAELPPIDFDRLGARVEAGLPEAAVAAELPETEVAAPHVAAELPETEAAAPHIAAELPEVTAPAAEVQWPELSARVAEAGAELPAAAMPHIAAEVPEVSAGLPQAAIEAVAPQPAAADDLTQIRGIGPVYARKLNAAGITTFAGLAALDETRLSEIIQAPAWRRANYGDWIAQARLAAGGDWEGLKALQATLFSARAGAGLAEEVMTSCPQDLSRVKGVGSVYEQKLYAAGIGTFWELAQVDDATLSAILGLKDFQAVDLAAIKAHALRLAEETGTVGRQWDGTPPDDFEPLEGIGPVYEGRLYDAGICTYRALAEATVEQLAEICRAPEWRKPDYASWIAQAKRLLGQEG